MLQIGWIEETLFILTWEEVNHLTVYLQDNRTSKGSGKESQVTFFSRFFLHFVGEICSSYYDTYKLEMIKKKFRVWLIFQYDNCNILLGIFQNIYILP